MIERDGTVCIPACIDDEALRNHLLERGGIKGLIGGTLDADGALVIGGLCDILIPTSKGKRTL